MRRILLVALLLPVLVGVGCASSSTVSVPQQPQSELVEQLEVEKAQQDTTDRQIESGQKVEIIADDLDSKTTSSTITEPTQIKPSPTPQRSCCKVCRKGKACGDSCISLSRTCHKGPGCACDG